MSEIIRLATEAITEKLERSNQAKMTPKEFVKSRYRDAVSDYYTEERKGPPYLDYSGVYVSEEARKRDNHLALVRGRNESEAWEQAAKRIIEESIRM